MIRYVLLATFALTAVLIGFETSKADEEEVKLSECPKAVQKTLKREATGGKIVEIEREREDDEIFYEADIIIDGQEYEVEVFQDGKLLSKVLEEVDIELADCPKAVQRTLKRESTGGEIEEIEKALHYGTRVYLAEIVIGEFEYEVEVLEDGTLLSKIVEEEEEEEEGEDENEDEEKDD